MGRLIGVVGGFAPEGATDFLRSFITEAADKGVLKDVRVLVDYYMGGMDEVAFVKDKDKKVYDRLLESVKLMQGIGADYTVLTCIEAHYYIKDLREETDVKFIDALDCTGRFLRKNRRRDSTVGILASSNAIDSGMFAEYLSDFRLIYPPKDIQDNLVMEGIRNIKGVKRERDAGRSRKFLKDAAGYLIYMGAQLLVSGSSDISAVLRQEHVGVCMVDPMRVLLDSILEIIRQDS